jgi:hypothetical protein
VPGFVGASYINTQKILNPKLDIIFPLNYVLKSENIMDNALELNDMSKRKANLSKECFQPFSSLPHCH